MPRQALAVLFKYVYEWHRFLNSPHRMTSGQTVRLMCNRRPRYFCFYFQLALVYLRFFTHHYCKICSEYERKKYIVWKDGCRTNASTEDEMNALNTKGHIEEHSPQMRSAQQFIPYNDLFSSHWFSQNSHMRITMKEKGILLRNENPNQRKKKASTKTHEQMKHVRCLLSHSTIYFRRAALRRNYSLDSDLGEARWWRLSVKLPSHGQHSPSAI